jgi:cobalamin biosynthetic protein CobC
MAARGSEQGDVVCVRDASAHGGRLTAAMTRFPAAPRPWLDLSTGINPEPWTGPRAPLGALSRLPDPADLTALEAAAARAFGVEDPRRVAATAGAEAGLRWIARLLPARTIQIVSPTYSSHEAAWRLAGARVDPIPPARLRGSKANTVLVVSPNNPDGHAWPRDVLAWTIKQRAEQGRWTLVDESFVETDPALSVANISSDRLVVFRSFGKFYGLAGLRLGFVVAPPELAAELRAAQGDWPVSAEAIAMGTTAYADDAWRARMRARLEARARELDAVLAGAGLDIVGGTSLFRLAATPNAASAFATLCEAGILTRPFADQPQWLRFGLPKPDDMDRLAQALARIAP